MQSLRFWMTPLAAAAWMQCGAAAWAQCAATPEGGRVAAEIVALAGQGQTRAAGEQPWSVAVLAQQLGAGADVRTLELSSAALLLADRTQIRMSASAGAENASGPGRGAGHGLGCGSASQWAHYADRTVGSGGFFQ